MALQLYLDNMVCMILHALGTQYCHNRPINKPHYLSSTVQNLSFHSLSQVTTLQTYTQWKHMFRLHWLLSILLICFFFYMVCMNEIIWVFVFLLPPFFCCGFIVLGPHLEMLRVYVLLNLHSGDHSCQCTEDHMGRWILNPDWPNARQTVLSLQP